LKLAVTQQVHRSCTWDRRSSDQQRISGISEV